MFGEKSYYKSPERKIEFPQFRLQSHEPFPLLCQHIAKDWIDSRNYLTADKGIIPSFILEAYSSIENLADKFPPVDIQLFLIVRGLLSSEVLLVAFKKRYRVNYGVNQYLSFNRLMTAPFRAKDVVADRTGFDHPDVALVLTHLSYYYSGLSDLQLSQCFNRLNEKETNPGSIYDQWVLHEGEDDLPTCIKQRNGVNLKEFEQRTQAKQFPFEVVTSDWDLSSLLRSKIIAGFSGINDTQLLLPVHTRQCDLAELQNIDAIVVNNLLQPENKTTNEMHARGTDFKLPVGFKVAVTLGNGLTKDRFVQAFMRTRKLGNGHALALWSSHKVHQQIKTLKKNSLNIEHN
ncbi:unnamed protein product [Rotaria magnacalcarata]|uniref:ubiquitinyl hydrolase 1 n=1 Tax=Rotaria magnacalcarata TaxID=392030 RepID=A0A816K993_9BILA|nr:unnamed protein product [Rotaria magnacalcarata]